MGESVGLDLIGDLVLADAALGDLMADMLAAIYDFEGDTRKVPDSTGRATDHLLGALKRCSVLEELDADMRTWLDRVKEAANDRNRMVHAVALDRCIRCGTATRFEHKGRAVDRSATEVEELIGRYRTRTIEGLALAWTLSDLLNQGYAARPSPGNPSQVRVGGTLHWCPACSGDGRHRVVMQMPPVVAVIRTSEDLSQMFQTLGTMSEDSS